MLRAVPSGLFSWNFEIFDGDSPVAALDLSWFRERGELVIQGRNFEIGREGVMRGAFFLRKDGVDIASATKPSAFVRSFAVAFGQSRYTLEAASPFGRSFELRQDNRVVGSIRPVHVFTRKAIIDLPDDVSLEFRVFITWLVIILWKRQHNSD